MSIPDGNRSRCSSLSKCLASRQRYQLPVPGPVTRVHAAGRGDGQISCGLRPHGGAVGAGVAVVGLSWVREHLMSALEARGSDLPRRTGHEYFVLCEVTSKPRKRE